MCTCETEQNAVQISNDDVFHFPYSDRTKHPYKLALPTENAFGNERTVQQIMESDLCHKKPFSLQPSTLQLTKPQK